MNIKKIVPLLISILVLIPIQAVTTLDLYSGITPLINNWLDNNISHNEFVKQINETEIHNDNNSDEHYYQKALLDLYKGQAYFFEEDSAKSVKSLESAISNAEKAISISEKSDYWRVIADSQSFIMLQKGMSYIIKNSKFVSKNAEKALIIDKNNSKASLIFAQGLVNAPALFGGDIKRGIKILEGLSKLNNKSKEERFNVLRSLSMAYDKKKKKGLAIETAIEALKIYPNNIEAKKSLASLKR